MTDLFKPFDLAGITLKNRIVMAPMTRSRATNDVADSLTALYYTQRATAGLIVSEGTSISKEGRGYLFNPGIHSGAQISGWKLVTDSVHAVGGHIFAQLWHVGRISHPSIQEGGKLPVSASSKLPKDSTAYAYNENGEPDRVAPPAPRQLTTAEVERIVEDFAQAAANAVEAGFDGVEIHGANGYLHEQFLNPKVNDRTDKYAADTLENRIRFTVEVIDAVVKRIGANRVGIRISPYGQLFDMPLYDEIDETYLALSKEIAERNLAYVHVMNQNSFERIDRGVQGASSGGLFPLLKQIKSILGKTALILAGGLNRQRAEELIEEGLIDLAGFGHTFISNPDLVARLENGWPLTPADRDTFYGGDAEGYVDYPAYRR
ncbi:alkene reductase [Pseudomonas sp. v388]|uniref:alkene reductase n=1 Tax=Pseudomonas sp. v388 TaxID=2479849 RepID=UPI000F79F1EC|nr:alkene reductase [Pseudomonas sp. v388]RRV10520.1 alkene reductase [Pseudomonas sp. v388]